MTAKTKSETEVDFDDPKFQEALRDAVKEICNELETIAEARDQVKEIIHATSEALGIEKGYVRKVANLYFKRSAAQFDQEARDIRDLYKAISTPKTPEK